MAATATNKKASTKKVSKTDLSQVFTKIAAEAMEEKKGENIISLDLRALNNAVTDFFIICHAKSTTQVAAIAGFVEEAIEKHTGESPWRSEGYDNAEWILLDYINIVVHVFKEEKRDFYGIERLWADAETQTY